MEVGPEEKVAFVNADGPHITDIKVFEVRGVEIMPQVADDAPRECVVVVEALRAKVLCVYICRSQVNSQLGNMSLG